MLEIDTLFQTKTAEKPLIPFGAAHTHPKNTQVPPPRGVNIKRELVLSPNDEEVANSSKKHTQFKTRRQKPYPVSDQNGRNWYPIFNQNG